MDDTLKQYHSALSQCAELLDNMRDGASLLDVPSFLAAKLAQSQPAGAAKGGANNECSSETAAIAAHLAKEPKAEQPSIHCQEFHELAMAYRSAPAFRANEPYSELVAYINSHLARQAQAEPVAYVNGDELDNMLDDRAATIQSNPSNWRKMPLYAAPVAPASAQNALLPTNEGASHE